jgi:hypothetical protein
VPTSRITRITAVALSAAACAAPAANAAPAPEPGGNKPGPQATPTVVTLDRGFDWGSAAAGAGGSASLLLVTAAGAFALTRRHRAVRAGL